MATKPNHVFTRANIPTINSYCGLNISTETEPESLGTTSTLTPTPRPPTIKLPATTPLSLEKAITEEKVLLHAITAMAEQLEQLLNREPNPEPDSEPNYDDDWKWCFFF